MRDSTSSTDAALAGPVTEPVILVELGFETVLRYASSQNVTWNGQLWTAGRLASGRPLDLRATPAGNLAGSLALMNHDNTISSLIFSEGARGKSCKIWYLYGTAPYDVDDAQLMFSGLIDGGSINDVVSFDLISTEARDQFVPRLTFNAELFPHMLPAESEIEWHGTKYRFGGGGGL